MRLIVFLLALIALSRFVIAQDTLPLWQQIALQESLPACLDNNPNAPAFYTKKNILSGFMEASLKRKIKTSDTLAVRQAYRSDLKRFRKFHRALGKQVKKEPVLVVLYDSLLSYAYTPKSYSDLTQENDWKNERSRLVKEFTEDPMHRVKRKIDTTFIELIKKHIYTPANSTVFPYENLNSERYVFSTDNSQAQLFNFRLSADSVFTQKWSIETITLYTPVFNEACTLGCFLLAHPCRTGICRSFVFIEKKAERWYYAGEYYSHLVN